MKTDINGHSQECNTYARAFAMARKDRDDTEMARTSKLLHVVQETCPECNRPGYRQDFKQS